MLKVARNILMLVFLGGMCLANAQSPAVDSLKQALKTSKEDTNKVRTLYRLAKEFVALEDYDNIMLYANQSLELAQKLHDKRGEGDAYAIIGLNYNYQAKYPEALTNFGKALKIFAEMGDKLSEAGTYSDMGVIALSQGNYPEALKYSFASLRLHEQIGDSIGIGRSYGNIGNICDMQENFAEAMKNYEHALEIFKKKGARGSVARCYGNMGNILGRQGNYTEALKYQYAALAIKLELGNKLSIAYSYGNLGSIYFDQAITARRKNENADTVKARLNHALENHFKAVKLREELGDKQGLADSYINVGAAYLQLHELGKSDLYLKKALATSKEIGHKEWIKDAYLKISELDSAKGDAKGSLESFKMYVAYRDSLFNEENTKKSVQQQMQYEFDKKEEMTHAEQERKDVLTEADRKRQNIILLAISCFGVLVLGFAIFAYRSFLQKKKANVEISRQKEIIEEKQKEILDSIYYARRIQRSLLPNEKYLVKTLTKLMD